MVPDLIWDFHAQRSLEFAEKGVKKNPSEQQFCGQNHLVNERGQMIRARLVKRHEGGSNANNQPLQQWYAEEHL